MNPHSQPIIEPQLVHSGLHNNYQTTTTLPDVSSSFVSSLSLTEGVANGYYVNPAQNQSVEKANLNNNISIELNHYQS